MKPMKYWNMVQQDRVANVYIYGDITSWPLLESDVTSYGLVQELDALDVDEIRVYINSFGGEVQEGMAICNALIRNKAKVITICDGFACSAASNIFMAGDERMMNESSLLFIHNAWSYASGDAEDLREVAENLETITKAALDWYLPKLNIQAEELQRMLDKETFIAPADAVEMGFATGIIQAEKKAVNQSARIAVMARMSDKSKTLGTYTMELNMIPEFDTLKALLGELRTTLEAVQAARQEIPPEGAPEGPKSFKERLKAMKERNA